MSTYQSLPADIVTDDKRVAYFRGRKLHGKALKVPEGYRGVVVDKAEPPEPRAPRPDEPEVVDLDAEDDMPLGALDTKAEFDEIVIWGHESTADTSSDPYVRGVEEWMKVAEKVRRAGCMIQQLYNYTDIFRYILTREMGSELVPGGIGRGLSSTSVVFLLGVPSRLRPQRDLSSHRASTDTALQAPSGTESH